MAVGQFFNYRTILEKINPKIILYLAIPKDVYQSFFTDPLVQEITEKLQMKLLVFVVKEQEIALWKE